MADKKEYPQWFVTVMQDFKDMRDAQNHYFANRNDFNLRVSKAKEGKADQHIARFLKEGVIKASSKSAANNNELFQ